MNMEVFVIGAENEFNPQCNNEDTTYKKMHVFASMTSVLHDYCTISLDEYTYIHTWLNNYLKNNKLIKIFESIDTFSDALVLEKLNDFKNRVIVYARAHGMYEGTLTVFCVYMHRYMYWIKLRNAYIEEYLSKIVLDNHKAGIRNIIYKYQNIVFDAIMSYMSNNKNEIKLDDSLISTATEGS